MTRTLLTGALALLVGSTAFAQEKKGDSAGGGRREEGDSAGGGRREEGGTARGGACRRSTGGGQARGAAQARARVRRGDEIFHGQVEV